MTIEVSRTVILQFIIQRHLLQANHHIQGECMTISNNHNCHSSFRLTKIRTTLNGGNGKRNIDGYVILRLHIQGGSNMTGTDLYVNKPH